MIESILPRENSEAFYAIATEFLKPGARVLDTTTGHKDFWKKLVAQQTLDGNGDSLYDHVFMDLRIVPKGQDLRADLRELPFARGSFDCIVFDPPYIHKGGQRTAYREGSFYWDDKDAAGMYNYPELRKLIDKAASEFYRVLRLDGLVILKLANVRESASDGGRVFPEAAYAWERFRQFFRLEAWLVQPITRTAASDWCFKFEHVYKCHQDWLVFRRAK